MRMLTFSKWALFSLSKHQFLLEFSLICGSSNLFHWPICLFLCQFHVLFNHHVSVTELEIQGVNNSILWNLKGNTQGSFGYWSSLLSTYNVIFVHFCEELYRYFNWSCIKSIDWFWYDGYLHKILIFTIPKYVQARFLGVCLVLFFACLFLFIIFGKGRISFLYCGFL